MIKPEEDNFNGNDDKTIAQGVRQQENKIDAIIQNLSEACLHLYQNNQFQAASMLWHAVFKAAMNHFLPPALLNEFLVVTTKQIFPLLESSDLEGCAQLATHLIHQGEIPECNSALYELRGEFKKRFKQLANQSKINTNTFINQISFDSQLETLIDYTSSYQASTYLPNATEACASAAIKITDTEKEFLADYYLKAWQAYQQQIDKLPEPLLKESYLPALAWLSDMVMRKLVKRSAEEENQSDWQRYRHDLKSLRLKLYESLPSLPLNNPAEVDRFLQIQRDYNRKMRDFLANIFNDCKNLLGEVDCAYGIFGVGSLSRDEAVLFSDLEYFIVLEPNIPKEKQLLINAYWSNFLQLFAFKIQSLGESGTQGDIQGLHIDDGLALSPNFKHYQIIGAIGTIEKIFHDFTFDKTLKGQVYSLLHPVYITGSHDSSRSPKGATGHSLFKDYQDFVSCFLGYRTCEITPASSLNYRESFAPLEWLAWHREEHAKIFGQPPGGNVYIDIKEHYVSPLSHIAFDLAYYFKLPIANEVDKVIHTADVWEAFMGYFDLYTIKAAKRFIATAFVLRILAQQHYRQQVKPELIALSDDISPDALATFDLITQLKKVYLYPNLTHLYTLKEPTVRHQLLLHETLLMWPLLSFLQKLNLAQPVTIECDNFLINNSNAILKPIIHPDSQITLADFVNYLADYLGYTEATAETYIAVYRHYYKQLSQAQRIEFLSTLKKAESGSRLSQILYVLEQYPNKSDGSRPCLDNQKAEWQLIMDLLYLPSSVKESEDLPQVTLISLTHHAKGIGQLNPAVVKQILNDAGTYFRENNLPGNHIVLPVQVDHAEYGSYKIHIKIYPEFPRIEMAVSQLERRLIGYGAPYSELVEMTLQGKTYPAIISRTVPGFDLTDILQDLESEKAVIDHKNHSQLILARMPQHETDGQPANYKARLLLGREGKPAYHLEGVDSDHVWADGVAQSPKGPVVQVISMPALLDEVQTKSIHPEANEEYQLLDFKALLAAWLNELIEEEKIYREMFAGKRDTYYRKLLEEDKWEGTLVELLFPPGTITEIYQILCAQQQLLKEDPALTPLQLQQLIEPLLATFYKKAIDENKKKLLERLSSLDKHKYINTVTGKLKSTIHTQVHLAMLYGAVPKQVNKLAMANLTPEQALEELEAAYQLQQKLEALQKAFTEKDIKQYTKLFNELFDNQAKLFKQIRCAYYQNRLIEQIDFAMIPNEKQQRLIIDTIKNTLTSHKSQLKIHKLAWRNAVFLKDSDIKAIVKLCPELVYLDLSGCTQLKESSIQAIAGLQHLEVLLLNNLPELVYAGTEKKPLYFPVLRRLQLNNNPKLKDLGLNAPRLSDLLIKYCPQMQSNVIGRLAGTCPELKETFLKINNQLLQIYPQQQNEVNYDFITKVVIVGKTSGKGCLLYRFTEDKFYNDLPPTIGIEFGSKFLNIANKKCKLQIWGMASREDFRSVARSYYRGAHVALLVYDITCKATFDGLQNLWVPELKKYSDCPLILVGNQIDLSHKREISHEEGLELSKMIGAAAFFECSAKTGENVNAMFYEAVRVGLPKEINLFKQYPFKEFPPDIKDNINSQNLLLPNSFEPASMSVFKTEASAHLSKVPAEKKNFRALQDKAIKDTKQEINPAAIDNNEINYDFIIKVIIVGSVSGKSCLLHRLIEDKFRNDLNITIGVEFGSKVINIANKRCKLQIWDTNPQEDFRSITRTYYKDAHVALAVYDITRRVTFNKLQSLFIPEIKERTDCPIILVGNQIDLSHKREISHEEGLELSKMIGAAAFFECSAKTGENVNAMFYEAVRMGILKNTDLLEQYSSEGLLHDELLQGFQEPQINIIQDTRQELDSPALDTNNNASTSTNVVSNIANRYSFHTQVYSDVAKQNVDEEKTQLNAAINLTEGQTELTDAEKKKGRNKYGYN